jgi:hypothetical protein
MFKFHGKNYKTLSTLNNAIKKSIKELEEDIIEVQKTVVNKTLGKEVVKRLKSTLKDQRKIALRLGEKTIAKPLARLFKSEFANIDIAPSKKKSSQDRQKIRFRALDGAKILEFN